MDSHEVGVKKNMNRNLKYDISMNTVLNINHIELWSIDKVYIDIYSVYKVWSIGQEMRKRLANRVVILMRK